jgi:hypothetical protein
MSHVASPKGGHVVVDRKIDFVMDSIVQHRSMIQKAHLELGIPLEDCITSTVRKAMKELDADPAQLELFWQERKDGKE